MKSILIKDTTREEREQIVKQSLWGSCGAECEFPWRRQDRKPVSALYRRA